jgi:hypothetical protein
MIAELIVSLAGAGDFAHKRLQSPCPSNGFASARASVDRHSMTSMNETTPILLYMERPCMNERIRRSDELQSGCSSVQSIDVSTHKKLT